MKKLILSVCCAMAFFFSSCASSSKTVVGGMTETDAVIETEDTTFVNTKRDSSQKFFTSCVFSRITSVVYGEVSTRKKSAVNLSDVRYNEITSEIIVPITEYIEDNYPNLIHLSITTNGTLLNKDRIDFMYSHNIRPHLSCDGDEFV